MEFGCALAFAFGWGLLVVLVCGLNGTEQEDFTREFKTQS